MVEIKERKGFFSTPWAEWCVVTIVLMIDLISKLLVQMNLSEGESMVLIPGFLKIFYTINTKAAFNFDFWLDNVLSKDGLRWFFIVFVSIATSGFVAFMILHRKYSFFCRLSLAMIVGGALGNLFDRIVYHGVRDFIAVEYFGAKLFGSTAFPIFNFADSALVVGMIFFFIYFVFMFSKDEKHVQEGLKKAKKQ